jgi:hypothetical protein
MGMTSEDIKFGTLALNNMKLDEMIQVDRSNGSNDANVKRDTAANAEAATGLTSPFITINAYNVTNFLINFNLDLSGFLPTIRFTFSAGDPVFISVNYPKDGDIVSVYMKSQGDLYKAFRMDFRILTVSGDVSSKYAESGSDPEGTYFKFIITAECNIPGLYSPKIKSFKAMTSSDALLEVSQELNLGYSTNEKATDDKMTWICPNYSYYDFIQEVAIRAYKDDETSFYDCWIDSYYNLNFINLGTQFAFTGDPKQEIVIIPGNTKQGVNVDALVPGTSKPSPATLPLVLTNGAGAGTNPFMINGYTLTSVSGSNTNKMGYITTIGFYDEGMVADDPNTKYIKYDMESQTPEHVPEGGMLQKGRARSNDYKEETRREWLGVLNTDPNGVDGVHKNFYHAKVQNLININDVTKMTLEVELTGYFPGIYRGQVIPVVIYVFGASTRQQNTGDTPNKSPNTNTAPTKDEFLSGLYVITGMNVSWSQMSGGMTQRLILSKRMWTANSSGAIPKAFPISVQSRQF